MVIARLIEASDLASALHCEHASSDAAGLDVPDQPALSVPTGERDRPEPESGSDLDPKEPHQP